MSEKVSFEKLINSDTPTLVDFSAEWCGPCKAMHPILQELAGRVKSKAKIVKIDVDRNQSLSAKLKIMGVPTFIVYKNGEQVWRASGMQSVNKLEEVINSSL
jgi:thioredoxin 1